MEDNEEQLVQIKSRSNPETMTSLSGRKKKDLFKIIKFRKDDIIEMRKKHKIPVKETFASNVRQKLAMVDLLYLLDWIVLNAEQIAEGTGDTLDVKLSYVLLNECVVQQNQEQEKGVQKNSIFSKESFEHNQNFQGVKFYGSVLLDPKTSVKKSKAFNGFFGN